MTRFTWIPLEWAVLVKLFLLTTNLRPLRKTDGSHNFHIHKPITGFPWRIITDQDRTLRRPIYSGLLSEVFRIQKLCLQECVGFRLILCSWTLGSIWKNPSNFLVSRGNTPGRMQMRQGSLLQHQESEAPSPSSWLMTPGIDGINSEIQKNGSQSE